MTKLEQAAREVIRQHSMECLSDKAVDALREALAEPKKPEECANGCPRLQVCDYCQIAEQAEQEPVDHIGIKHDAQLVETFLRCPMTGKQLYFASEPIQKNEMNYILLQDDEGNDWTLIARLDEGWDGK